MLVNKDLPDPKVIKVDKDLPVHKDFKELPVKREIPDPKVIKVVKVSQVLKGFKELPVKGEILEPKVKVDLKDFKVRWVVEPVNKDQPDHKEQLVR